MLGPNRRSTGAAQPTIDVSITAPETVEAGETVTVDAAVTVSESDEEHEVAVTFAGDDRILSEETVMVEDVALLTFEHAFAEGGEYELGVAAVAVVDGEEVRGLDSHTLEVAGDDDSTADRIERDDGADVSRELIEAGGWRVTDEHSELVFEENQGPVTVTGEAYTTTYENEPLRESVAEMTLGNVDAPLSIFFTTWIDFSPPLSDLPEDPEEVISEVEVHAKQRFVDQLRQNGLAGVHESGERTIDVATGQTARVTDYEASFSVEDMSVTIVDDRELVIAGDEVSIAGVLAIWDDGDDVFVAGGAYPATNYETTVSERITEAVEVTIEIDLGLTPDAYEDELVRLVQSVS